MNASKRLLPWNLYTIVAVLALLIGSRAGAATLYVDLHNPTPPNPYEGFTNWTHAATNIQDAVDVAQDGDTILVRPGRYTAATDAVFADDSTNVLNITLPVVIRAVEGRGVTLIDGEGLHRGLRIAYGQASPPFILDGFTVTNCFVTEFGAGAFHSNGNNETHYLNSLFVDNVTERYGAGISDNVGSDLVVSNSVFLRNRNDPGDRYSAAIFKNQGWIEIYDSHFEDNESNCPDGTRGGAMWVRDGWIENSVFLNNRGTLHGTAASGGGGVFQFSGHLVLRNCLFAGNVGYRGGGYINDNGSVEIINCTFYDNHINDGTGQGGVYTRRATAKTRIHNTIMFYNSRLGTTDIRNVNATGAAIEAFTHNCTEPATEHPDGEAGFFPDGNIADPPRFADPDNGNFQLSSDSPCINAGTNLLWMAEAVDLAGNPRLDRVYNQVDIGAFEYQYAGSILMIR